MTKEELCNEYIVNNKSTRQIGKEYDLDKMKVLRLLHSYDIPTRPARRYKEVFPGWSKILEGAKRRRLEFTITPDYIQSLFDKQQGRCALSGLPLKLKTRYKDSEYTASLDRIDSSIGYIPGNVQWVHKHINKMKMEFDNDYFIECCRQIALHHTPHQS